MSVGKEGMSPHDARPGHYKQLRGPIRRRGRLLLLDVTLCASLGMSMMNQWKISWAVYRH